MNVIERAILFSQMLLMYYTGNGALTLNLNVQEVCSRLLSLVIYAVQGSRKPFIIQSSGKSFFKTPGEIRIVSDEVLRNCIKEGVKQGLLELGDIEDERPVCRHFKAESSPELTN